MMELLLASLLADLSHGCSNRLMGRAPEDSRGGHPLPPRVGKSLWTRLLIREEAAGQAKGNRKPQLCPRTSTGSQTRRPARVTCAQSTSSPRRPQRLSSTHLPGDNVSSVHGHCRPSEGPLLTSWWPAASMAHIPHPQPDAA